MPPTPRRALALALVLAVGFATVGLAGCASSTVASAPTQSASPSDVGSAWLDDGRAVGIVTSGSSSCVPYAGEPKYDAKAATLTVELIDPAAGPCTMDYAPRASLVSLPTGVDPAKDLQIVITGTYAGHTSLVGDPALKGSPGGSTQYLPSAGWYTPGGFLILTWGSSSCVPQLTGTTATSSTLVTATFATPPANQVCTADIAPRVTVAAVTGIPQAADVQVVLTGAEFVNVKIPIAGKS